MKLPDEAQILVKRLSTKSDKNRRTQRKTGSFNNETYPRAKDENFNISKKPMISIT